MIKKVMYVGVASVLVCIYLFMHVIENGFRLSSCPFSDNTYPIAMPANSRLVLERDIYNLVGSNRKVFCSENTKGINNQIVTSTEYDVNGRRVEMLKKGSTFIIQESVVLTQHTLINSGTSLYYVLVDERGKEYLISDGDLMPDYEFLVNADTRPRFSYYVGDVKKKDIGRDFSEAYFSESKNGI